MIDVLATVLPALLFATASALLVARWLWPERFPWWKVVVFALCSGWVLLVLNEHIQDAQYEQCVERRFQAPVEGVTERIDPECPFLFIHGVYTYNVELGWLWALIYLGHWLVLYGIAQLVRKRAEDVHA